VSFVLPSLKYWDLLLIDREMPFSGSQRYEAEMAIKHQTTVNTDHRDYSGSGFVDGFSSKGDSVSFYAKFYAPASRTITLRYANAGSLARRSIVVDGEIVGEVTTGMFSPTTKKYLGLAFVPADKAKLGDEIDIVIRDKPRRAVIVKRPFYVPAYRE